MKNLKRIFLLATACLISMATLRAQVHTCVDLIKPVTNNGADRGVFDNSSKWTNGSTLNVKFTGGDSYVREKIVKYARIWENYANIKLNFSQTATADILISFDQNSGSWSYVGRTSRDFAAAGTPSMNFGWFDRNTTEDEFSRTTLHEFGHALGLLHEHKNANSEIQWNVPVVYNYYQSMGWSIDQINSQVLSKYSVTLSNRKYDPLSIMHYPIPKEHTLNGYSVGWNSELSREDIAIIKEMYPGVGPVITDPDTSSTSTELASSILEDVTVEYNVYEDGMLGMRINSTFTIANAKGKTCMLAAYFYTADGDALTDLNGEFKDQGGNVALGSNFIPKYENTRFNEKSLFIPYDEFHLGNGEHRLKFTLSIWDDQSRNIGKSGAYYFDYSAGSSASEVISLVTYDDDNERIIVMPKFTINNAMGEQCYACVYFYDAYGNAMIGYNGEQVAFCQGFVPAYETTYFNNDYYSDLYLYIPYESIVIPEGVHTVKYFVAIFQGGEQIAESDWVETEFEQY